MDTTAGGLEIKLTTISSAASGQVVYNSLAQGEGQDYQGCDPACAFAPDADVQLSRIQGCAIYTICLLCIYMRISLTLSLSLSLSLDRFQSRLPPLCLAVLHRRMRIDRQRIDQSGDRSSIRGANGQVLRQRVRTRHYFQLPKGILYLGRAPAGGRDAGEQ